MVDRRLGRYRLYSVSGKRIFAAPSKLRRAALQRYQPSTAKRAAYRWLMRLGMLTGADRLVSRAVTGQMFGELEAIGLLFPKEADSILMDIHAGWLDAYHQYWFTKWNGRINAGQIPTRSPA